MKKQNDKAKLQELRRKLKACQKEAEKNLEGWQRAQADLENFKKAQIQAQEELTQILKDELVLELLPLLDNFSLAFKDPASKKPSPEWVAGIKQIKRKLESILDNWGVKEIPVQPGETFNPKIHEAIETAKAGSRGKDGEPKITKVFQKGYQRGSKILRPAQVRVCL